MAGFVKTETTKIEKNAECQGFTLIEILVAIVILGISLVTIMQLFSGGLKSCKVSDEYTRAVFHARQKMEEVLIADSIIEGIDEGDFDDDFKWHMEISCSKLLEDEDGNQDRIPVKLYEIKVRIQCKTGAGKSVEIQTLKMITHKQL
jgi:general secretion pathway protein I